MVMWNIRPAERAERRIRAYRRLFCDLSDEEQQLIRLAYYVRHNAQAPYSKFRVGAAVLSDKTGNMYQGCNVERCSYTQTTHAEQNAVDTLVAEEGREAIIRAVAIVAAPDGIVLPAPGRIDAASEIPVQWDKLAPCGHCLQCISENARADRQTWLLSYLLDGTVCSVTIKDALPFAFSLNP
jgi:cytidine deaminase